MPWKETCVMDMKVQLLADWMSLEYTVVGLSRKYQVSRKTVYKWIRRYEEEGPPGLIDRSSAPIHRTWATSTEIISYILAIKTKHKDLGPKKIITILKKKYPDIAWPAASTAQAILRKEGWVKTRHRRKHTPSYTEPFIDSKQPNDVWCADFKGDFLLGEGNRCYPLTITDSYSRYLLCCRGLYHPGYDPVRKYYEQAFREYGLPRAIRTDNGTPFASVSLGGLTRLSVWLIKLGITPERIEPGKPQQNGRHERFHRTLKEATIKPPRHTLKGQQKAFDRFKKLYNDERPHEGIGQKTPDEVYRHSERAYPDKLQEIGYADELTTRYVKPGGNIKWKGDHVYVSKLLSGETIGLKQIDDRSWEVYFSFHLIGIFDESLGRILAL